jgi:hypothetical protein
MWRFLSPVECSSSSLGRSIKLLLLDLLVFCASFFVVCDCLPYGIDIRTRSCQVQISAGITRFCNSHSCLAASYIGRQRKYIDIQALLGIMTHPYSP